MTPDQLRDTYHFFWFGPFSQWHICKIQIDGRDFNCAEQAMMYQKATLFGEQDIAEQIARADHPGKQKALCRKVAGFDSDTWEQHQLDIVTQINFAKFRQNKGLRRKLFQTADRAMVEASPFDTIWGIGLDETHALTTHPDDWPGLNLLGQAITSVKTALRVEYPDETTTVTP